MRRYRPSAKRYTVLLDIPRINYLNAEILKMPDVSRGEGGVVGQHDAGGQEIADVD